LPSASDSSVLIVPNTGLDGDWDIVSGGKFELLPSEMRVSNRGSAVVGSLIHIAEGTVAPDGCTCTMDRAEFSLNASGNTLNGTVTYTREWKGSSCPPPFKEVNTVSGIRTRAAAPSLSDLNGDWEITLQGEEAVVATVNGTGVVAWDKAAKERGGRAAATVSVAGGILSVQSQSSKFDFAARRR